ncbi:D-ribose pyranase [Pararobbsia alpina]|uniref:D-ribose pyranase n=1 Tax=Pararobbsia alpina TaxID=621374 RepID=A0A6S7CLK3_9BURK|nr:D-ribose pyranase [Pararobbsia alpina]CAB3782934.1 D-ribose pyranase [Pararobbsia alpina]
MKKTQLLNAALSRLIASLGHGDMVLVSDAGMPTPHGTPVEIIDLALAPGMPGLVVTTEVLLTEMQVESHIVAHETFARNDGWLERLPAAQLGTRQIVSHEEIKKLAYHARAVIRTGECTPYANLVLIAGVTF